MKIRREKQFLYWVSLMFFSSGIAGLIYEITWERLLGLYFGVTNVSIGLIVCAYMAGLGLGSMAGGYLSNRTRNHLLIYGLVELGVACFAVVSPNLIVWIGTATAGVPYMAVFFISFFILLIPTFFMGMTLPLLMQAFVKHVESAGETIGLLYGINTLGAAAGAFLAGFFLIGWLGLDGAIYIACLINFAVGLSSLILYRFSEQYDANHGSSGSEGSAVYEHNPHLPSFRTIEATSFLVGFLGLGYEMIWIRILTIVDKNTVYGFPAILGVFLVGLALGGYYFGKRADASQDAARLFWRLEITVAYVSGISILLYWLSFNIPVIQDALFIIFREAQQPKPAFVLVGNDYAFSYRQLFFSLFYFMIPILWLVLIPSFFIGAGLPVLDRIAIQHASAAGKRVGIIHLMNILGSITGTILVNFFLLGWLGTELTLKLLILLSLSFILSIPGRKISLFAQTKIQVLMGILVLLAWFLPGQGDLYQSYYRAGTRDPSPTIREYSDGVIAFTSPYLWIKGDEHGSYPSDGTYESIILPCLGASHPSRVLVIGLGGGNTVHFLTTIPGIKEIVVVELMQELDGFIAQNIPQMNEIFNDTRVTYIDDDGRRYLYSHPDEKFDMIFTDPLRNYSAGHDALYSEQANQLYLAHLTNKGVYCQWKDEDHIIPYATAAVFPKVDSFRSVNVASTTTIYYDLKFMQQVVEHYLEIKRGYLQADAENHLNVSRIILSFTRDEIKIQQDELKTSLVSDLKPILEYYLFRQPINHFHRIDASTLSRFILRLNGCNDKCKEALYQKLNK